MGIGLQTLFGTNIPDFAGLVTGPGGEELSIFAEINGVDPIFMPLEGAQAVTGLCIPDPCRPVPASRNE